MNVRLLFPDATKDLGELIRQIDEIKPAHLIFDTIGAVQPVVLENRNRLPTALLAQVKRDSLSPLLKEAARCQPPSKGRLPFSRVSSIPRLFAP